MTPTQKQALLASSLLMLALGLAFFARMHLTQSESAFPGIIEIEERGRRSLDFAALNSDAPLELALRITEGDDARESRPVRIMSQDGRRLDITGHTRRGEAPAIRLQIAGAFLRPGVYMIEVTAAERHPLNLRRYVLEIR